MSNLRSPEIKEHATFTVLHGGWLRCNQTGKRVKRANTKRYATNFNASQRTRPVPRPDKKDSLQPLNLKPTVYADGFGLWRCPNCGTYNRYRSDCWHCENEYRILL